MTKNARRQSLSWSPAPPGKSSFDHLAHFKCWPAGCASGNAASRCMTARSAVCRRKGELERWEQSTFSRGWCSAHLSRPFFTLVSKSFPQERYLLLSAATKSPLGRRAFQLPSRSILSSFLHTPRRALEETRSASQTTDITRHLPCSV